MHRYRRRPLNVLPQAAFLGLLLASNVLPARSADAPPATRVGAAATLSGKVTRETIGTAGARVIAYGSFPDLLAFRPAAVSEAAGADGGYRLSLPPGTYYLVARGQGTPVDGTVPVGGLFAFHGSNPFTLVPGSTIEVNFSLARKVAKAVAASAADPGSGSLGGTVTFHGKGIAGAQVKLCLDEESAFRGAGYAAAPPTGEQGEFAFEMLPESAYFVVTRKREDGAGADAGPLAEGDLYGYFADNPVQVSAGKATVITIEMVSKGRDVGNADGRPRPSGTRIAGRITDAGGAVVRGVYAFAYEEKVMAHKKPEFISQAVDAEGRYVINLSRGGTFYIGARSAYGDSPRKGEWYGRYDGTADHAVKIEARASAEGIDIRVERILQ